MGFLRELGSGPVALDTSIFVYFIEEHPAYLPLLDPLFEAIAAGEIQAVTSALTLLEVLVVPFRFANAPLIEHYENILTRSLGLRLIDLDREVLRSAALLRAATRAKTPDAIQLACALGAGCPVFLTNDNRMPKISGLRILQLDQYLR